jgi:uncharacterized protein YjiS (DUF1127 family)
MQSSASITIQIKELLMANCIEHSRPIPLRRPSLLSTITQMIALRRQRQHLDRLSDEQLKDIGVTRDQAEAEARRKAWDAPNFWLS